MGGFSNGAHATQGLLDASGGELAHRFAAFFFVEGGGRLQHYEFLKGHPFLMVSSNAKSRPRASEICEDALAAGEIRILFRDNDFDHIRNQSIRIIAMHASQSPEFGQRFMKAYVETVDWIFSDDKAVGIYADLLKVDLALAKKLRDEFWNRQILSVDKVRGIDLIMADALEGKFLQSALTKEQINEMIAPYARP